VGMTQILALDSLDIPSGGVIDCALTEKMEVVVGDRNPRCRKKKGLGRDCGSVRVNAGQTIPGSSTIGTTSDGNDVESLGLSPEQL